MQKHRIILLFIIWVLTNNIAFSQKDTVKIKEVEINSNRVPMLYSQVSRIVSVITKEQISSMPARSVQDVLKYALSVDVRERGPSGVQSDISIRGGSYEQTLILLNGVKIHDPQTGHSSMNIPVDINDIERIEILEGPGSRIFGPNAFSGAINIITVHSPQSTVNSQQKGNTKVSFAGGEHKYYSSSISEAINFKKLNIYASFNTKKSDGYMDDTDFKINNFLYQADYKNKDISMNLMASYLDKSFGAYKFYSTKYPNQYEHLKTNFVNFKTDFGEKLHWTTNLYWRRNQDKFLLKRDNPSFYTNNSLTDVFGLDVNTYFLSKLGKTAFGAEATEENILSTNLGEPLVVKKPVPDESPALFTNGKSRDNINLFAEHAFFFKKFASSFGLLAYWTDNYKWNIYPGIDLSYQLSRKYKIFASINKSLRIPSYTDLYSTQPDRLGNANLKPEEAITYEAGIKYLSTHINGHLSAFRRFGTNIIDWAKPNLTSTIYQSMNINELTTDGVEVSADLLTEKIFYKGFPVNYFNMTYSYLTTKKYSGDYVSLYALDYLKHKFTLCLNHKIIKNLSANWAYSYYNRTGINPDFPNNEYKPYSLLNGRINWKLEDGSWRMDIYLEAANVLNKSYVDIGNIEMPGRWVKSGVVVRF